MEIERLYTVIIEVEDCKKKLSALPTHTEMRKQVQDEKLDALHNLCQILSAENRFKRYLLVRKGKALLKRSLRLLDEDTTQHFCSTLFQMLPHVTRRDKEDKMLPTFWPDIKRHLHRASFGLLHHYLCFFNAGASSSSSSKNTSYSTFKNTLSNPLGLTIVLTIIKLMDPMLLGVSNEEKRDANTVLGEILSAVQQVKEVAKPLEKVEIGLHGFKQSKELKLLVDIAAKQWFKNELLIGAKSFKCNETRIRTLLNLIIAYNCDLHVIETLLSIAMSRIRFIWEDLAKLDSKILNIEKIQNSIFKFRKQKRFCNEEIIKIIIIILRKK